jgi:AraC-like DNA-binding protein
MKRLARSNARLDTARLVTAPGNQGVELFEAVYSCHTFGRHAHDALAIGVVDDGFGECWYRGATHGAKRDTLVLIGVGEPHTGGASRDSIRRIGSVPPLRNRMLYIRPEVVLQAIGSQLAALARFATPTPNDAGSAAEVRRLFALLRTSASRIEQDAMLAETLRHVVMRHGERRSPAGVPTETGRPIAERCGVAVPREYLHSHFRESVSLEELGAVAGLNARYLSTVFREGVGLPPHAYQTYLRLRQAKELLAAGEQVARVAAATGFADQSHLHRHFRRAWGLMPGAYREAAAR